MYLRTNYQAWQLLVLWSAFHCHIVCNCITSESSQQEQFWIWEKIPTTTTPNQALRQQKILSISATTKMALQHLTKRFTDQEGIMMNDRNQKKQEEKENY